MNDEMEKNMSGKNWNYLIQHFSSDKAYQNQALYWFNRIMKEKKIASPSVYTLSLILKPYSAIGDEEKCEEIIKLLEEEGKASVYSYMYYVDACVKNGNLEKATNIILEMRKKSIEPFDSTYIHLLKEARQCKDVKIGMKILHLIKRSNMNNRQISMNVITLALKMKKPIIVIEECEQLRRERVMDIISWNCLIKAVIQKNDIRKAIELLDEMVLENVLPNSTTFTILITACANSNLYEEGKIIHSTALNSIQDFSIELSTATINFYTKCGHPDIAIHECEKLRQCDSMNVISWTCLIQAHIELKEVKQAIELLKEMAQEIAPNHSTFSILITACANSNLYEEGNGIHNMALATIQDFSIELSTSIVNFYTKCGYPEIAIIECEKLRNDGLMNIITWTCLIQAYIQLNDIQKAIELVNEMVKHGTHPNSTTFTILLTACANSYLYEEGKHLHNLIMNTIHDFSIELSTAIINFYTKCGHPEIAIEEYKLRRKKSVDLIWWNSILQAFVLYDFNQAIQIFQEMHMENILPDKFTYVILLVGCGDHVATLIGKRIVSEIIENGMEVYEEISSAIIYFYFRIGESEMAEELFETLVKQGNESNMNLSIITFNNMLSCYAQYGRVQEAISLFNSMIGKKIDPNQKTFSIMLNAFSHCGMIQEAIELYGQINSIYGQETNLITTGG